MEQILTHEDVERTLSRSDDEYRAIAEEQAAAIRQAEAAQPEKERFDLARLGQLFDMQGDRPELGPDPDRDLRLAYRYWVDHPETTTLAAFARVLQGIAASGET